MAEQKPTPARIVHYVVKDAAPNQAKECPAIVTSVQSDTAVTLKLFPDPSHEGFVPPYVKACEYAAPAAELKPDSWHWPTETH
jgi:hypothetical protein